MINDEHGVKFRINQVMKDIFKQYCEMKSITGGDFSGTYYIPRESACCWCGCDLGIAPNALPINYKVKNRMLYLSVNIDELENLLDE